jgi:hypothetical protein
MRRIILGVLVMSAALAGGCTGSGTAYYGGGGTLTATTVAPDLVYVSPGVQVVADYDYPVFYADNYYWRFDNGHWYRSSWYTGGWAYATPPYAVARIDRPYAYRHYRPSGYISRREYRDHRRPVYRGPAVRDHRSYRAPVYRDSRPVYRDSRPVYRDSRPVYRNSGPAVRDHRSYRAPAPAPAPAVRDHRSGGVHVRDHRR